MVGHNLVAALAGYEDVMDDIAKNLESNGPYDGLCPALSAAPCFSEQLIEIGRRLEDDRRMGGTSMSGSLEYALFL